MQPLIELAQLPGTPVPMLLLELHHLTHHCLSQSLRTALGPARMLPHPLKAVLQKTLAPFIPRLGADPILPAQLTKILGFDRSQYKLGSLVHRFYAFPWHQGRLSKPPPSVTYVLNHLCYRCIEPGPNRRGRKVPRLTSNPKANYH